MHVFDATARIGVGARFPMAARTQGIQCAFDDVGRDVESLVTRLEESQEGCPGLEGAMGSILRVVPAAPLDPHSQGFLTGRGVAGQPIKIVLQDAHDVRLTFCELGQGCFPVGARLYLRAVDPGEAIAPIRSEWSGQSQQHLYRIQEALELEGLDCQPPSWKGPLGAGRWEISIEEDEGARVAPADSKSNPPQPFPCTSQTTEAPAKPPQLSGGWEPGLEPLAKSLRPSPWRAGRSVAGRHSLDAVVLRRWSPCVHGYVGT
ncbi:MAG: hypothetical protein ACI9K5_001684 [Gammaproteobacteria bacterium]|jgi:hypothetical protein